VQWFIFPHAGGSKSFYSFLTASKPPGVVLVEYPGRGSRWGEQPLTSVEALADLAIAEYPLDPMKRFCVFGHSFGALVGLEFARRLKTTMSLEPTLFIVSACRPPWANGSEKKLATAPDDALVNELLELGGTPRELLENEEFLPLILRAFRADLIACENYRTDPSPRLGGPLLAIGGRNDKTATRLDMTEWSRLTTGDFRQKTFDGDHFYLIQENGFGPWFRQVLERSTDLLPSLTKPQSNAGATI
jgi:surfactin synthase thioesterase subunit